MASDTKLMTSQDFVAFMSKLMDDVVEGRVSPDKANAATKASGALLKMLEMQLQWGAREEESPAKPLLLVEPDYGDEHDVRDDLKPKYPTRSIDEVIGGNQ